MNSISVVIITFNEEKNIGRCLESLKGISDEIIVVDSYSTDKTKEICEQSGARFFSRAWEGYSSAKNYGNTLAKGDLILSVDADEVLSDQLKKSILEIKNKPLGNNAFVVNRLTNYCEHWVKYCGWYPDKKLRMWKNGTGKWDGILHEKIVFENNVETLTMEGDLLHYSFHSISDHVKTMNSFSEVAAQELVTKGKNVNVIVHLMLNPFYTFINKYFFRLGFLDGYYGFVICSLSATANFLKYSKALSMKRKA